MLGSGKKGQVTVFILIGIVALILIVMLFYFVLREVKIPTDEITKVPARLSPVESFVSDCVSQTARKAFDLLGSQGGWISVQDFSAENDVLKVSSGIKIPY